MYVVFHWNRGFDMESYSGCEGRKIYDFAPKALSSTSWQSAGDEKWIMILECSVMRFPTAPEYQCVYKATFQTRVILVVWQLSSTVVRKN